MVPIILSCRRQRQEDLKVETSLGYIARSYKTPED
jgi:hypothetical protein